MSVGVVLCLSAVAAPLLLGRGDTPAEVDMLDGAAWLASESSGHVVRVNGETGRVDARLELGELVGKLAVEQGDGTVLVDVGDEIRSVDLANLNWGASIEADADLVVGDGAAYMVSHDGLVRELDPATLETLGEIRLHATPGPGVVSRGRLVLPLDDGTVKAIDGDEIVADVEAGGPGDTLHVTVVGNTLTILNQSEASLRELDPASGDATEPARVEVPDGELLVPRELPSGHLWLTATRTGELVGIAPRSGRSVTVPVARARSALTAPVAVDGRVYVVDRTSREVVEIDDRSLEVVRREPLGIGDAAGVEVLAKGGKVFVNDKAGALAIVIDGDEHRRVDKYRDEDGTVHEPTTEQPDREPAPADPPAATPEAAPGPGPVGTPTVSESDGAVTLSWGAPASSTPVTYEVSVTPGAGAPVSTAETAASFSGLTNGVEHTFTIVPVNDGGAGPGTQVVATPGRQPTIGGVAVERVGNRTFRVGFTVDGGGRPVTGCSVSPSVGAPVACDASSGSVSVDVDVPQFNTEYSFTPSAANAFGTGTGAGASGTSAGKPLVVESAIARWDGACTGTANPGHRPRYSTAAHQCGTEIGWVSQGTTVRGLCHEAGAQIRDDYLNQSSQWVRVAAGGYMSTLYFATYTDTQGTIAGLPPC